MRRVVAFVFMAGYFVRAAIAHGQDGNLWVTAIMVMCALTQGTVAWFVWREVIPHTRTDA